MEYTRLGDVDLKGNIGNRVFVSFLALGVEVKPQKDGQKYIMFDMVDCGTKLEAKIFGASEDAISKVIPGKVYFGAVDIKKWDRAPNGISGIIYNMSDSDLDPDQYLDWSESVEDSQKIIESALGELGDSIYKDIVYPILVERWGKMYYWSAAVSQHHTRLGDLVTHTAEVVELASSMADFFNAIYGDEFINKSLLISSAILHDIGKTEELDVDTTSGETSYSVNSTLKTHIMDSISMVDIQAYKLGLGRQSYITNEINEDEELKTEEEIQEEQEAVNLLKHCLAAHHGKKEWGSPIEPSIPEAYLLHVADNIGAEMFKYNRDFCNMQAGESSTSWGAGGMRSVYKEISKI